VEELGEADVAFRWGRTGPEVCKRIGVSRQTHHRRRQRHGAGPRVVQQVVPIKDRPAGAAGGHTRVCSWCYAEVQAKNPQAGFADRQTLPAAFGDVMPGAVY
jgi:hypothetical protein